MDASSEYEWNRDYFCLSTIVGNVKYKENLPGMELGKSETCYPGFKVFNPELMELQHIQRFGNNIDNNCFHYDTRNDTYKQNFQFQPAVAVLPAVPSPEYSVVSTPVTGSTDSVDKLCSMMELKAKLSGTPSPSTHSLQENGIDNFAPPCNFCKRNGETPKYYTSHQLREGTKVTCPVLRLYICPVCGATGDNAHTVTYCPFNGKSVSAVVASRTPRKSCGCRRKTKPEKKCCH